MRHRCLSGGSVAEVAQPDIGSQDREQYVPNRKPLRRLHVSPLRVDALRRPALCTSLTTRPVIERPAALPSIEPRSPYVCDTSHSAWLIRARATAQQRVRLETGHGPGLDVEATAR